MQYTASDADVQTSCIARGRGLACALEWEDEGCSLVFMVTDGMQQLDLSKREK